MPNWHLKHRTRPTPEVSALGFHRSRRDHGRDHSQLRRDSLRAWILNCVQLNDPKWPRRLAEFGAIWRALDVRASVLAKDAEGGDSHA